MSSLEMLELELENLELNLAYVIANNGSMADIARLNVAILWHRNAIMAYTWSNKGYEKI